CSISVLAKWGITASSTPFRRLDLEQTDSQSFAKIIISQSLTAKPEATEALASVTRMFLSHGDTA
ncbi:MAG: hypothetical protein LBL27_04165, partial [Coriobacteriales bacterium]|nr:hypothetical protein [Coriobacteriales bacterium]